MSDKKKMMKVTMLAPFVRHHFKTVENEDGSTREVLAGTSYPQVGKVVEWPEDDAKRLIEQGFAEPVKQ